ncbi:hypothetical protein C8J56DRAFT_926177 [Mycena floridula]|nr:hypothetical protein C8J56DRAFT_926177 [Mycena floridula]
MNKLRKVKAGEKPQNALIPITTQIAPRPVLRQSASTTDYYWASRALAAETLLTARAEHYRDVRHLSITERLERSRELAALEKGHETRLAKLERLVIILISLVAFLAVLLVLVLLLASKPNPPPSQRQKSSHFTIPILSPFSSVVEHETSLISSRTISLIVAILGMLGVALFWLRYGSSR